MKRSITLASIASIIILASIACVTSAAIVPASAPVAPTVTAKQKDKPMQPEKKTIEMMVVNSGGLRLREAAGTDAAELAILQDGCTVIWTGRTETPVNTPWYEVRIKIGFIPYVGWVNSKYLREIK